MNGRVWQPGLSAVGGKGPVRPRPVLDHELGRGVSEEGFDKAFRYIMAKVSQLGQYRAVGQVESHADTRLHLHMVVRCPYGVEGVPVEVAGIQAVRDTLSAYRHLGYDRAAATFAEGVEGMHWSPWLLSYVAEAVLSGRSLCERIRDVEAVAAAYCMKYVFKRESGERLPTLFWPVDDMEALVGAELLRVAAESCEARWAR